MDKFFSTVNVHNNGNIQQGGKKCLAYEEAVLHAQTQLAESNQLSKIYIIETVAVVERLSPPIKTTRLDNVAQQKAA